MDWTQILVILITTMLSGGVASFISARSKARVDAINAETKHEISNLQGCLSLVNEQQEQIKEMKSEVKDLNNKLLLAISQMNTEERQNIRDVATLSVNVSHLRDRISEYEERIVEQNQVISILQDELKTARDELSRLKKKLKEYEGSVNG